MKHPVSTAIILDTRRAKNDGTYPVKLRITYERKRVYYPTGENLSQEDFDKAMGERPRAEHKDRSIQFAAMESRAVEIIQSMATFSFKSFDELYGNTKRPNRTCAFVLMDNHYHLIGLADPNYPLPKVMHWLQRSANSDIIPKSGRMNHLFGGRYKSTLLSNEFSYYHAFRYVYRNPVTCGIVKKVEDYEFSSLLNLDISCMSPIDGHASLIPPTENELLKYLNCELSDLEKRILDIAISKPEFKIPNRIPKKIKNKLFLMDNQNLINSKYTSSFCT